MKHGCRAMEPVRRRVVTACRMRTGSGGSGAYGGPDYCCRSPLTFASSRPGRRQRQRTRKERTGPPAPTGRSRYTPTRQSFGTPRRDPPSGGSHLGSPLRSGRSVLIRSVSRRVGSVACVRADASPNEVPDINKNGVSIAPGVNAPLPFPGSTPTDHAAKGPVARRAGRIVSSDVPDPSPPDSDPCAHRAGVFIQYR